MNWSVFETSFGPFGFVVDGRRLVRTYLPQPKRELVKAIKSEYPEATSAGDPWPAFRKQVQAYFAGKRTAFPTSVDLSGVSTFHLEVLERCQRIPFGKTMSYGELAKAAGSPNAARAVGGAMGRNPIPLVIPCHRVLRSDGSIGGFSSPGGARIKERMLALEGVHLA